ncbi:hypothetical protein HK099_007240 [Clydaea vesicula]|uniref:RING-type domain-containing protein n=1 Tax=Clydaea vesicula TaxID=447962 RepID=A0AAD5XTU3_9FUNG|nr:hypothetical protein HK099_007240 [Clydaea vesicula]
MQFLKQLKIQVKPIFSQESTFNNSSFEEELVELQLRDYSIVAETSVIFEPSKENAKEDYFNLDSDERNCSICLHAAVNTTILVPCRHSFCYECLLWWLKTTLENSKVSGEQKVKYTCCNCRVEFTKILHSVSNENFFKFESVNDVKLENLNVEDRSRVDKRNALEITVEKRKDIYFNYLKQNGTKASANSELFSTKNLMLVRNRFSLIPVSFKLKQFFERDLKLILDSSYDTFCFEFCFSIFKRFSSQIELQEELRLLLGNFTECFIEEIFLFVISGLSLQAYDELQLRSGKYI